MAKESVKLQVDHLLFCAAKFVTSVFSLSLLLDSHSRIGQLLHHRPKCDYFDIQIRNRVYDVFWQVIICQSQFVAREFWI